MAEMPVLQEQKPALCPNVRRGVSLQSSLARVPAVTRFARPSGQPAAVTPAGRCLAEKFRQRPRIVRYLLYHDPCPASRRAWLPAFFSGGLARLGRKNSSNLNRFLRPAAGIIFLAFWLFGFLAFWLFGFLAFWLFGFLAFWLFG